MVAVSRTAGRQATNQRTVETERAILKSVLQGSKLLRSGSSGKQVRALQRLLKQHGAKLKVDGDFGPKTKAAVRGFQRSHGLKVDGVVGKQTATKLLKPKNQAASDRFVRVGNRGKDILGAEQRLRRLGYNPGQVDGKYDQQTARAMRAFKLDQKELKDNSGQHMGAPAKKALRREVRALKHDPFHARVTKKIKLHKRLDAQTAREAARAFPPLPMLPDELKVKGFGQGERGRHVKNVQQHLRAAGYDPQRTDGKFDQRTAGALKAFQRETGLEATGRVDKETWHHLKQSYLYAKGAANPAQTIGERSGAVKKTERALKKLGYKPGKVDGHFDVKLRKAVKKYERDHKLKQDGKVGKGQLAGILARAKRVGNGRDAYKAAMGVLGKNAAWVKTHGELGKYMPDWVPNNVNCASFVSACLQKAGLINNGQHQNSCYYLSRTLDADKDWKKVSLSKAKPGDVVMFRIGGDPRAHTVLFAGWKNGQPTFIGSNNVNPDGSQRITKGHMGYPITEIWQHRG